MYALVPLLMVSGLLCLYPQFSAGQAPLMLTLHMVLAVAALIFLCAHIYLCTLGIRRGRSSVACWMAIIVTTSMLARRTRVRSPMAGSR